MKARYAFVPAFLLFLLLVARITWTPIDTELASVQLQQIDYGPLSGKAPVVLTFILLLPFLATIGNPLLRLGLLPCALYLLAAGSVLWTSDVGTTLFTLLTLTGVFGYALAANALLGPDAALRWTWLLATTLVAASIVLAQAGDPHAVMGGLHLGAWRGVFGHKNAFGPFVSIHLLLTVFARSRLRLPAYLMLGIAALDLYALYRAHSSSALIGCAAALLAGLVFVPIADARLRALWRGAATLAVLAIGVALLTAPEAMLGALGRDATLSNRTVIWETVYGMTFDHLLGTGYGTGGGSQVSIELQKVFDRDDTLGVQSGYLNLALELGWPAVVLFALWLAGEVTGALRTAAGLRGAALFVALAVQHLVLSFSESAGGIYPGWSLAVLGVALVALRRGRATAGSGTPPHAGHSS